MSRGAQDEEQEAPDENARNRMSSDSCRMRRQLESVSHCTRAACSGTIAAGASPSSVAVDPSGKFAYVANADSGNVSMYTIDATTGALTLIGTIGR